MDNITNGGGNLQLKKMGDILSCRVSMVHLTVSLNHKLFCLNSHLLLNSSSPLAILLSAKGLLGLSIV
jgi:hypothetical protein